MEILINERAGGIVRLHIHFPGITTASLMIQQGWQPEEKYIVRQMKGGTMKYLLLILLLGAILVISGCSDKSQDPVVTAALTTPSRASTPVVTTAVTTILTPEPTPVASAPRKITDGFWCRDTTINIDKASTDIRECFQFFPDGTYKWGYSPGRAMGKSPSCPGDPALKCTYFLNAKGQYQVMGGYYYTLSGDELIDPHDPPYFLWSSSGIP